MITLNVQNVCNYFEKCKQNRIARLNTIEILNGKKSEYSSILVTPRFDEVRLFEIQATSVSRNNPAQGQAKNAQIQGYSISTLDKYIGSNRIYIFVAFFEENKTVLRLKIGPHYMTDRPRPDCSGHSHKSHAALRRKDAQKRNQVLLGGT
jgi:hypothetical protein